MSNFIIECARNKRTTNLGDYEEEVRELIDNTKVCLCCGKKLTKEDFNRTATRGYCSLQCFREKPPRMAYAMKELDIKDMPTYVLRLLNDIQNVTIVADLLGVRRNYFNKYLKKLGITRTVTYIRSES